MYKMYILSNDPLQIFNIKFLYQYCLPPVEEATHNIRACSFRHHIKLAVFIFIFGMPIGSTLGISSLIN